MKSAATKAEFLWPMEEHGYAVTWTDWGDREFALEDEEVDTVDTPCKRGTDYSSEPARRISDGMSIAAQAVELAAELSDLEDRRPIEDCTTLPQKRERRKWEQSM